MSERSIYLFLALVVLINIDLAYAQGRKKVVVKYRSHTQLDFSGNKIGGKIRAPAVFYVFQRKRSKGHQVISPPENFREHKKLTINRVKEEIEK